MTYNFSVALCYLTLHQIIQKLEKLIFLLKCVARWFLNLDTRFNWAPLPFSIISWVHCTVLSPDGFFVSTVWQGFGGGRGRAFFPLCLQLLSTWLITMERKWIKMSYLHWKSATKQKQLTLPNPSVNLARKRKHCHHRFICILILTGLSFQCYLWTFRAFVKSHMAFWVVHITSCALEAIHTAPFGTIHTWALNRAVKTP